MPTSSKRAKDRPADKTHCLGTWSSFRARLFLIWAVLCHELFQHETRKYPVRFYRPALLSHIQALGRPCVQSSRSEHVFSINKRLRKKMWSSSSQLLSPQLKCSLNGKIFSSHLQPTMFLLTAFLKMGPYA